MKDHKTNLLTHVTGEGGRPSFDADMSYIYDILRLAEFSRVDSDYAVQLEAGGTPYRVERILRTGTDKGRMETSAVVFRKEDTVYVSFRGTNMAKREHWLRNFRFLHDPVGEGYAHRGFNQTLQWPVRADYDARERPLQDVLYEALRELRQEHPECTRLVLCGHSAGGAMAQVLAAYYLEQPADAALKLEELYTFASPRALTVPAARKVTQHFAQRGDSNCLRFVHHQDNVAQLPPKKIFLWHGEDRTYRHVGQPVVILPDLELLTPKSVTQFQKLHGVSATFARGGTPEIDSTKLSPHHLVHYLEMVGALAEREEGVSHYWRSAVRNHSHLSAVREKDEAGLREFARKGSGGDVLLR